MNITINVSGKIFETTIDTLMKIPYFNNMFVDCDSVPKEIIFINRPHNIFEHVLNFMIDPLYPYPLKYAFELDFYDIKYDVSKLYDKNKSIETRLNNIELITNETAIQIDNITSLIQNNSDGSKYCLQYDCENYACDGCNYCSEHYDYGTYCDTRNCNKQRMRNSLHCDDVNHYYE